MRHPKPRHRARGGRLIDAAALLVLVGAGIGWWGRMGREAAATEARTRDRLRGRPAAPAAGDGRIGS